MKKIILVLAVLILATPAWVSATDTDNDGIPDLDDNCPLTPNPEQEDSDMPEGIISYWKFDEVSGSTAYDSVGQNHGAVYGAQWTTGQVGGALSFDGTGQYVVNEGIGASLNGLNAVTFSLWCKSNVIGTDSGALICTDPDRTDNRDMRYDKDGAMSGRYNVIKCGITSTDGIHEVESSDSVQTTCWQHIVMTWQSGELVKIYINGQLDNSYTNQPPRAGTLTGYTKLIVGAGGKDTGST